MSNIDTKLLDGLISGRVDPHIYAFSTRTIPNYLKVGDTYRPVEKRLDEWRKCFPDLEREFSEVAKVDNQTFFRDYAIHAFLEASGKTRLQKEAIGRVPYFSNEFFKDTGVKDLEEAVADVRHSHADNDGRYQFYRFDESRIPVNFAWERTSEYPPRPNQQQVINHFNEALKKGRTNLLMYAVMRFGKSFTSMCCATEMDARFVVIVSAKADVKAEWKKSVESHKRFSAYEFLDSDSLLHSGTVLTDELKKHRIALFLTLQDLRGEEIKAKHKELFENKADLLLVDESHFGARGNEYGKVLSDIGINRAEQRKELSQSDDDLSDLGETLKTLNAKVCIHLSGTPYRILMGSEFTKDDIIAFCQFTDIVEEQKSWNEKNSYKDGMKEWDNPYYGFPQMIRFAFHPNESSIKKMDELKRSGITYALSALFKPQSIVKDRKLHKHQKFVHEQEIIELLEAIDGSRSDDYLLGFLDYKKIKEGKMCRHMVCVLPYRASCDALQNLLNSHKHQFRNLGAYEIINIAGVDNEHLYKNTGAVKERIRKCELEDRKTITLTVNRMLTGSTVEEWDTMLYFKDTASPQEYDQAVFRLQNQYVSEYRNEPDGDRIRFNMKPQTLLVDFDPYRLFRMQEQKSQIYNANVEDNGNDKLEERMKRELDISPVVVLDQNKIKQVNPADILKAVSDYSSGKSVSDEAAAIPIDFSLLEDNSIKAEIERQPEINSKEGLKIKAFEGDGGDLDVPDKEAQEDANSDSCQKEEKDTTLSDDSEMDSIRKKFATYYSRLLFFAFLTNSRASSVKDVLSAIDANKDNGRIAQNLEISQRILELFRQKMNPFVLSKLDYKIQNLNTLANDVSLAPIDRAVTALRKIGRLSGSEIVTPSKVADEMVAILPEEYITSDTRIFDIAAKQGEFAVALFKKFGDRVRNNVYSATTSKVAYEFTRKIYEILGMPAGNVFDGFNSYDIIGGNNEKIIKELKDMNFNVIIGNPPYQSESNDERTNSRDKPIYNIFVEMCKLLNPKYLSLIIPARWMASGLGLNEFRASMLADKCICKLVDYPVSREVFQNVEIKGGVCYFLRNAKSSGICEVINIRGNNTSPSYMRNLDEYDVFVRDSRSLSILRKIINKGEKSIMDILSVDKEFGWTSNYEGFHLTKKQNDIPLYYNRNGKRLIGYIDRQNINKSTHLIDKWKVMIPQAGSDGGQRIPDPVLGSCFITPSPSVCTQTFLFVYVNSKEEATNIDKYVKTKFSRFLVSLRKITQHATRSTYRWMPQQQFANDYEIDWNRPVSKIDQQLYAKYGLTGEEIAFIESRIKSME